MTSTFTAGQTFFYTPYPTRTVTEPATSTVFNSPAIGFLSTSGTLSGFVIEALPPSVSSGSGTSSVSSATVNSTEPSGTGTATSTRTTNTATSTNSAIETPGSVTPSYGLAGGTVAGIAIACLIAGSVIGAAAIFFLLRRRRRGSASNPEYTTVNHQEFGAKGAGGDSPVSIVTDDLKLGHFLPAPVPDKELAQELQALGYLVQQHVENHYHLRPVSENTASITQHLSAIGIEESSPVPAAQLAPLVLDPRARYTALQHILSAVIFGSLVMGSRSPFSLLPSSVVSLSHEMPPAAEQDGNSEVVKHVINRWRQLTTYLLNADRNDRSNLKPTSQTRDKMKQLASALEGFLGFFVESQNEKSQQTHLQQVILECSKFGYALLSQPGELVFNFSSAQGLVIQPGLVALRDEHGAKITPVRQILAPSVANV